MNENTEQDDLFERAGIPLWELRERWTDEEWEACDCRLCTEEF